MIAVPGLVAPMFLAELLMATLFDGAFVLVALTPTGLALGLRAWVVTIGINTHSWKLWRLDDNLSMGQRHCAHKRQRSENVTGFQCGSFPKH